MSIAPHTGIVDFGTFTAPTALTDGIQGEVPQPLAGQEGYVLTGTGWASAGSVGLVGYQGTWNALTNTPTLTSSVGVQGYYYVVNIAGTTNLNGITDWQVGDWAIFNGSIWQKVDNTDSYDPANVAITGGTINNTTIGATTPSTGVFTSVTTPIVGAATGSSTTGLDLNVNSKAQARIVEIGDGTRPLVINGGSAGGSQSPGLSAPVNLHLSSGTSARVIFYTNGRSSTQQAEVSHTASAVNYHQLTGSATGSGPIHSVAGSDTNIDLNLTTKGTGVLNFNTGSGTQARISDTASAVNFIQLTGGASGATPAISIQGAGNNVNVSVSSKGTGAVRLFTNNTSQEQLQVSHTASAVNYVQVTGAATGSRPTISAAGSDSNVDLNFVAKGTSGGHIFTANNVIQAVVSPTTSAVNYLNFTGGATGTAVKILANGTDTNIPLVLQPKGTGALQAQQTDSTATGGNARGSYATDLQKSRSSASNVASGGNSFIGSGNSNSVTSSLSGCVAGDSNFVSGYSSFVGAGNSNTASNVYSSITTGVSNVASGFWTTVINGSANTAAGYYNFIGNGQSNSGTSGSAVTTQSGTMNGTTAVTLSGSNASIKVGQYITGTSIAGDTYVAAISGTSLTLSKVASGSSTSTLFFYTPHGVVVGGGNNQATGSYSFIGGGGDAGTAANRNVASGDWSVVVGGFKNTAIQAYTFIGGGNGNVASSSYSTVSGGSANGIYASYGTIAGGLVNAVTGFGASVVGGYSNSASGSYSVTGAGTFSTTRGINSMQVISGDGPISGTAGSAQSGLLILGRQTTDATATRLASDGNAAGTTNQVILPNNSAYAFKGTVIANVTGGGNTKAWSIEGAIKRGANAASTALVGTPTVTSGYADAGASTWAITATADTTNGGLAITFTGQAGTTIRVVAKLETTEVTF